MKKVAIIMGSDSDWPVVKGACTVLKDFGVPYEAHILSAHRTPEAAAAFARSARAEGYGVILCAAGMAAHLAGAFAANTTLPVVGIPMKGGAMDGLDALLATVQMPSGFPVATVALNGAKNAAYLAVAILAVADDELAAKLDSFRADTAAAIAGKDAAIAAEAAALEKSLSPRGEGGPKGRMRGGLAAVSRKRTVPAAFPSSPACGRELPPRGKPKTGTHIYFTILYYKKERFS